jgi:hemerythrin-like metal-binding protein
MIEWNDKYNVNISLIDKQHKNHKEKILEILNEMTVYALKHFTTEESYMIKFNYPEYQYHKEEHMDFSMKTLSYQAKVLDGDRHIANEILEYLKQWMIKHIQVTDRKYVDCFRKNGLKQIV